MSIDTLFGVPLVVEANQRDRWIAVLTDCWRAQMGRRPGSLADDIDELAVLFGTGSKPKTIRDKVHAQRSASVAGADELPEPAVVVLDGVALITPEGRILLHVLVRLQRADSVVIEQDLQAFALDAALRARSTWHATWLRKQFEGSLSAPAVGAALLLLVNGSVGTELGLLLPKDADADRQLGAALMPVIAGFSSALGGKESDLSNGVRQHWAFTQISRLLGRQIAREPVPSGTLTYIREGQEKALLEELSRRLENLEPDPHRRREAVIALVDGYREARGALAAVGQSHEEPTATRRIVSRLTDPVAKR